MTDYNQLTVVARQLPAERRPTQAAWKVAEVLPNQAFHIIAGIFFTLLVQMLKHMVISYTTESPVWVHESGQDFRKICLWKIPEEQCIAHTKPKNRDSYVEHNSQDTVSELL